MLDNRFQTFLALCETGSYTKTAELLSMTQPAVSQHIKFLEEYYQVELIAQKEKASPSQKKAKLCRSMCAP